jgi:hypothetical protein
MLLSRFEYHTGGEVHQEFDDVEKTQAGCGMVRSNSFKSQRQDGGAIEAHCSVAVYGADYPSLQRNAARVEASLNMMATALGRSVLDKP